jgi:hypothetical protein
MKGKKDRNERKGISSPPFRKVWKRMDGVDNDDFDDDCDDDCFVDSVCYLIGRSIGRYGTDEQLQNLL